MTPVNFASLPNHEESFRLLLGGSVEMPDRDWHEFIQDDPSTFPPDLSSIQVIFASGRLIKGIWRDGMVLHEYKIPESKITRWRFV